MPSLPAGLDHRTMSRTASGADAGGADARLVEPRRPVALDEEWSIWCDSDVPPEIRHGGNFFCCARDEIYDLIPHGHLEVDDRLAGVGVGLAARLVLAGMAGPVGCAVLIDHLQATPPRDLVAHRTSSERLLRHQHMT